eukprot:CFRG8509T1
MGEVDAMKGVVSFAFLAGLAVGAAVYSLSAKQGKGGRGDRKKYTKTPEKHTKIDCDSSDAIYAEQFVRNTKFFGEEGQANVHNAFVIVVGLGGVGSHCATSLLRSGVGKMRLIDFDQVSVSSLNRHAVARRRDVGLSKVKVIKDEFAEICPRAEIDARTAFFSLADADDLLSGNPDYVVDCIDNLTTKAELIVYCEKNGIKVISSMGAGAKADVCQMAYGTLMDVEGCDLGLPLRVAVRRMGYPECRIPVVYSTEKAWMKLLPLEEHQEEDPSAYKPISSLRVRVIPVLGTMPSAMGLALASYVLCDLADQPIGQKPLFWPVGPNFMRKMHTKLCSRARKDNQWCDLEYEEVEYMVTHIFRGRSVLSGTKQHPVLVRWDKTKPYVGENLIQLTENEATKHAMIENISDLHPEYIARVEALLSEVKDYMVARVHLRTQNYENFNSITDISASTANINISTGHNNTEA